MEAVWTLTKDKFKEFKKEYPIYKKVPVTDEYGEERNTFNQAGSVFCMWQPIQDEATIQNFGADIENMKQSFLYDEYDLEQYDQIEINNKKYEVVSLKEYQNYTLCVVKKVI